MLHYQINLFFLHGWICTCRTRTSQDSSTFNPNTMICIWCMSHVTVNDLHDLSSFAGLNTPPTAVYHRPTKCTQWKPSTAANQQQEPSSFMNSLDTSCDGYRFSKFLVWINQPLLVEQGRQGTLVWSDKLHKVSWDAGVKRVGFIDQSLTVFIQSIEKWL